MLYQDLIWVNSTENFSLTKGFVLQECVVSPNMFDFQNSW